MRISYNKLWKMLIDKNMKKSDLKEKAGISSASLAKLGKGDNITTDVLLRMYGATIGKLGILEISVTTNQACCACIPYAGMNNKYLFYYLMSMRQF